MDFESCPVEHVLLVFTYHFTKNKICFIKHTISRLLTKFFRNLNHFGRLVENKLSEKEELVSEIGICTGL